MLVHHFLENSARRFPDKTALVFEENRYTYARINSAADYFAAAVRARGIGTGERMIIYLENSFEAVVSIFGALKAGLVFIPVNPGVKRKKLRFILEDSSASLLIASRKNQGIVEDAVSNGNGLKCLVWCDKAGEMENGKNVPCGCSWETFLNSGFGKNGGSERIIDCDLAVIIYTSGSTGDPKGVMCSHRNVVFASGSIAQYLEKNSGDVILNALPLSFDYGLYQVLMTFRAGGTLILERHFGFPYRVLKTMEIEKATGFPIVPSMAALLFRIKNLDSFDFSSLRYITNTAAFLSPDQIRKLRRVFPKAVIYSMYGLTECKRVSYLPPDMVDQKPGSVGLPIPGTRVFLVDENGNEIDPENGKAGELVVCGSHVMQGYWNNETATAKVFKNGAYRERVCLYTGDLFVTDSDGFLYFTGRKDDQIKVRGERVSPKEIEEVLMEFAPVSEAAVIGVPDEISGQAVKAYVVLERGGEIGRQEILQHCIKRLEPLLVPKYIEIVDRFAKTANGKIDKKFLQDSGTIRPVEV